MHVRLSTLLVLWLGLLLAGCGTIDAKVTQFNAWPPDAAGARFAFRPPAQGAAADLEQATYEAFVRTELERRGLVFAPPGTPARLQVEVQASGSTRTRTWSEPIVLPPPVWVTPWPGYGYPSAGYWGDPFFGGRYVGERRVTETLAVNQLKVRILDGAGGTPRPVFDSAAVYEGGLEDLPLLVPLLARAVFDDFPGRSGQVRRVRFDARTGELRR